MKDFKLSDTFLDSYKTKDVEWGPLGEVVYLRTYSRKKEDGANETWWETLKRVVEGTYNIQKRHCDSFKLPWKDAKAQKSAQTMYDKMFNFKFLPPGRGLWAMGSKFVEEKGGAALNNCAFISTSDIELRGSFAFTWAMDALMLGVGVGFDAKGDGKIVIKNPARLTEKEAIKIIADGNYSTDIFSIPDSREGWVESLGILIDSFFLGKKLPTFKYNLIRPYGTPIKGFGGVASGPEPLKIMHESIEKLLKGRIGQKITSTDIVDIFNMIGVCVVAGNVRRSAEIAIGNWDDKDYTTMKDYNLHQEEMTSHRWASNNSIFAEVGKTDYNTISKSIALNGEPGIVWLENIRKYGRLNDAPDWKDILAAGTNPCVEGNTVIETTKGRIRIKDMVERYNKGENFDVYSMNKNGELEIKPAFNIVRTKTADEITTVTLGNGNVIRCTPEHKFFILNQNGEIEQVEAQHIDVKKHTPIILQRIKKSEKYLRVKLNTQTKYIPEHRFVAGAYEDIEGKDVHHKNEITYDNSIDNLEVLEHGQHSVLSNIGHDDWANRNIDGTFAEKDEKAKRQSIEVPAEYLTNNGFGGGDICFVSIENSAYGRDVYDMTVMDNHNFIANGVVIHNCAEQTLESGELCCLVETFPSRHDTFEEYKETLKYAYLYGKTVTLLPTHWPETNAILLKNRRIGLSQTGIIDSFVKNGRRETLDWSDKGYNYLKDLDNIYSNWLCIPKSIKITSIKPSGSVSLLPGVSAGIHYPHDEYYIRRIRIAANSQLAGPLIDAGIPWEFSVYGTTDEEKQKTLIFSFPVFEKFFDRKKNDVSIWEQVKNCVDYQRFWADNNVSITVTFSKEEEKDIPKVLEAYEDSLKSISFLPIKDHNYAQAPYESITKEKYEEMIKSIKKPDFSGLSIVTEVEKFCTNDGCAV